MTDAVWEAVVPNLIWTAVVGAALFVWYRAVATRRAARIWGVSAAVPFAGGRRQPPTVIVATSGFSAEGRPMTGVGQVRAIALLTPSILRAYGSYVEDDDVRMSAGCNLSEDRFARDLVTIGGPKTNEITRDVLARLDLPVGSGIVSVAEEPEGATVDRIYWKGRDARQMLPGGTQARRFALGLVVRCENPIYGRGVLTVLAGAAASGSGTYGTEAAAAALVQDASVRGTRWAALRGSRTGYLALVRAEIVGAGDVARLLESVVIDKEPIRWRASTE